MNCLFCSLSLGSPDLGTGGGAEGETTVFHRPSLSAPIMICLPHPTPPLASSRQRPCPANSRVVATPCLSRTWSANPHLPTPQHPSTFPISYCKGVLQHGRFRFLRPTDPLRSGFCSLLPPAVMDEGPPPSRKCDSTTEAHPKRLLSSMDRRRAAEAAT